MWTDNIYYNPEKFGLELVVTVELAEPDYSFDELAIWRDEKGYYLATDSGCSCPSPFESYNGVEDLTGPLTAEQVREEATTLWSESYGGKYDPVSFASAMDLIP